VIQYCHRASFQYPWVSSQISSSLRWVLTLIAGTSHSRKRVFSHRDSPILRLLSNVFSLILWEVLHAPFHFDFSRISDLHTAAGIPWFPFSFYSPFLESLDPFYSFPQVTRFPFYSRDSHIPPLASSIHPSRYRFLDAPLIPHPLISHPQPYSNLFQQHYHLILLWLNAHLQLIPQHGKQTHSHQLHQWIWISHLD